MANRFVRYAAAFVILVYGFAKINGSQFTILDSELDKPMGQVSEADGSGERLLAHLVLLRLLSRL